MYRELPDLTPFDAYRFCQHLKPSTANDCVEWQAACIKGYGSFKLNGKNGRVFYAHRIAYWLATGTKPPVTLEVCHTCNNRKCCNPQHLYLDTQKGNMEYASSLGRMQGTPKITGSDVLEIRQKAAEGAATQTLATEYLLAVTTIRAIVTHRTWKHVGGPVITRKGGSDKLTPAQVNFIRQSNETGVSLASKFGVSKGTISNVRRNKTYKEAT
jgi:hypothetical protein